MDRLRFCSDEHVPRAFETALAANGFTVVSAIEEHEADTVDRELLRWCTAEGYVLVTNDRDFVELDTDIEHAGILVSTTQILPAGAFVRGVRRIDRQYAMGTVADELLWLEQWL